MDSNVRIRTRTLGLALAALLSTLASGVCAGAEAQAIAAAPESVAMQQPAQELETLDEVWIRGKHLSRMIEDAEDDFFALYNKVNKNHDYDVYCGYMSLSKGSMIMSRTCIPGFIFYNYDRNGWATSYPANCPGMVPYQRDAWGFEIVSRGAFCPPGYTGFEQPPPELYALAHREKYAKNVLQVVGGDPRLLKQATYLADLYSEMKSVQTQYVKVKKAIQGN
ncbi:MAG: hypothetical protein ABIQ86_09690 [Steroidobacteraceae bacterium]